MLAKPIEINWNSDLSIYASELFLRAVEDEYGWLGGFDESGSLRCILPYTVIRKAFIRMARFRVETIPVDGDLDLESEKAFLNSVMKFFRSQGVGLVIPATTNTIFRTYPDGAVAAPYGSLIIDLTQPLEVLWNNLHSKHRNVVRNAKKKGVEIRNGLDYMDTAYELVRDTLKRSKLRFLGHDEYNRFIRGLDGNVKIFIADYQGVAQGCAIIPFSNYGAYYLYGGSIENPLTGAMNLLQWEAIKTFKEIGVKRYDFVGVRINPEKASKQEGLMKFKERFGGQLCQGYMWKYPLHPLRYAVYSQAVRFLRGGDIVDQERHKLESASTS